MPHSRGSQLGFRVYEIVKSIDKVSLVNKKPF